MKKKKPKTLKPKLDLWWSPKYPEALYCMNEQLDDIYMLDYVRDLDPMTGNIIDLDVVIWKLTQWTPALFKNPANEFNFQRIGSL